MVFIMGLIGAILVALSWIPQTFAIIKKEKINIDIKFGVMYIIGGILLIIYSIQIKDIIFLILNLLVVIMSSTSLIYSIKKS